MTDEAHLSLPLFLLFLATIEKPKTHCLFDFHRETQLVSRVEGAFVYVRMFRYRAIKRGVDRFMCTFECFANARLNAALIASCVQTHH
jgi:hypothetical protein